MHSMLGQPTPIARAQKIRIFFSHNCTKTLSYLNHKLQLLNSNNILNTATLSETRLHLLSWFKPRQSAYVLQLQTEFSQISTSYSITWICDLCIIKALNTSTVRTQLDLNSLVRVLQLRIDSSSAGS